MSQLKEGQVTMDKILTLMLLKAYPYLSKRAEENPEPELVQLVKQIETLSHIVNGDYS